MNALRYAVIDVETTGGYAGGHRITEVGIAITDGTTVLETYQTLINPECNIPQHITALTGISNDMVATAPTFAAVAAHINEMLSDAVFVAHNVNFDFSFIRMEMARVGLDFRRRKLCTARYARGLLTDQQGFSLAKLAHRFKITNDQPHRALSDALTAAHILHHLLRIDRSDVISKKISRLEREVKLPLYLSPEQYHSIPNVPGIYVMYGKHGKPIYIGKAKRLKQRVAQHFMQSERARTQAFMKEVVRLETHPTGTEFMALIKEDVEIRKYWPKYNSAQKKANRAFHVISFQDRNGIIKLGINKSRLQQDALRTFSTQREALLWLHKVVEQHELNAQWCSLGYGWQEFDPPPKEEHNKRLEGLLEEIKVPQRDRIVLFKGRTKSEKAFVWLREHNVYALGFAPDNINWQDKTQLTEHAEIVHPSTTINNLVASYLSTFENTEVIDI